MYKSDHYYRRILYKTPVEEPVVPEVQDEQDKDVVEREPRKEPLKPSLDVNPELSEPTQDLWRSPSDDLLGLVCLNPPLTGKYMKALTHQGLLSIGKAIEQKALDEAELEKQKALLAEQEALTFSTNVSDNNSIGKSVGVLQAKCDQEKEEIENEFAEKLQDEIVELEERMKKDFERGLRKQQRKLDEQWKDKLIAEVDETIAQLTTKFINELSKHAEDQYKKFNFELKKEKTKHQLDLQEVRKVCQESFSQLKHQLECKNIGNIMYILCSERRKCRAARQHMENSYQKDIENMQNALMEKDIEIIKLIEEKNKKIEEIHTREELLREMICQYQKFIYFALNSCPTQAEFLLDTKKLITFDISQNIADLNSKPARELPTDVFPWKTASVTENAGVSNEGDTLIAKDYHQCWNEIDPLESDEFLKTTDYLPAMHYNENMYVREDFRNMMSRGIYVSHSNTIWNTDVDRLQKILWRSRGDIDAESEVFVKSERKTVPTDNIIIENPSTVSEEEQIESLQNVDSKDILCPLYVPPPKVLLKETKDKLKELSCVQHQKSETLLFKRIKPCCAKCTQTYIKRSPKKCPLESESKSFTPKDSLIKYRMQLKSPATKQMEDTKFSKLDLAKDSFLVHKHSMIAKRSAAAYSGLECKIANEIEKMTKPKKVVRKLMPISSKLSLSKDSLELLRSQTMITKRKIESKESVEIKNGIVGKHFTEENDSRTVKVSHIEIIPDDKYKKSKIGVSSFDSDLSLTDSPWLSSVYKAKDLENRKILHNCNMAKIVGDTKFKVDEETQKEFTLHRASSMLCIFRKHPSLLKLFTPCVK